MFEHVCLFATVLKALEFGSGGPLACLPPVYSNVFDISPVYP